MKQLSTNIGYIVGIIGFAGVIWSMAVKTANKDFNVSSLKKEVVEVKAAVDRVENKIDTASVHYTNIELKQNDQLYLIGNVRENQEVLKTSFEKHLKMDKRYEELVQFLESYKFDVQKAKEDSLQYKIKVTPKKIEK
jgi:hypothetical protein